MHIETGNSDSAAESGKIHIEPHTRKLLFDVAGELSRYLEAAYAVIAKSDEPLSNREIGKRAVSEGLLECTPERAANIIGHLLYSLGRSGVDSPFTSPEPGKWDTVILQEGELDSIAGNRKDRITDSHSQDYADRKPENEPRYAGPTVTESVRTASDTETKREDSAGQPRESISVPSTEEEETPRERTAGQEMEYRTGASASDMGIDSTEVAGGQSSEESREMNVVDYILLETLLRLLEERSFPMNYFEIKNKAARLPDTDAEGESAIALSVHDFLYTAWLEEQDPRLCNVGLGYWGIHERIPPKKELNKLYHKAKSIITPVPELPFGVLRKISSTYPCSAKRIIYLAEKMGFNERNVSAERLENAMLRECKLRGSVSRYISTSSRQWKIRYRYPQETGPKPKHSTYSDPAKKDRATGTTSEQKEPEEKEGKAEAAKTASLSGIRSKHIEMITKTLKEHGKPMDRLSLIQKIRKRYGKEVCENAGLDFQRLTQVLQKHIEGHSSEPIFKKCFGDRFDLV